jgi:parvulin-like peptidyl-prolyl isomerase
MAVSFAGIQIEADAIVDFLKRKVHLQKTCQQILYSQIVQRSAQERGIVVTDEEMQAEGDRFRYDNRLESSAATFAWLAEQMITADDWENGIRDRLLAKKLAEHLFGSEVDKCFAQNQLDYEKVSLYRIVVPYRPLAQELFYQIEESEISFFEAAHLYDIDETRRLRCGYEGALYRWNFKPDLAAEIFRARPGEVVGPFPSENHFELLMVEAFVAAELTETIRQEIQDRLFNEWLESELNYWVHSGDAAPLNLNGSTP